VRLYWHPFSIFPRRIRIVLREKRIACEEVIVDLPGGALATPEFRKLNPFGQVPVLEDDGLVLYESVAILEYLEERHPRPALMPTGNAVVRARTRQLMLTAGDYLTPPFHRWLAQFFTPEATWDRADQARAADEIAAHLDVLEDVLADGRTHLTGAFSLADVCYAPFVCELATARLGHLLDARSRVHAWVDRLNARESISTTGAAGTL
jgi:glutathione S-transferase